MSSKSEYPAIKMFGISVGVWVLFLAIIMTLAGVFSGNWQMIAAGWVAFLLFLFVLNPISRKLLGLSLF